ncbi:MAG: glycosyltransferase [Ignisphaera sp.]
MVVLSFITKNTITRLKDLPITLYDVLNSTLQIPYKTIILIDDSKDNTVTLFKKWCDANNKELVVSRSNLYGYYKPTRATARQTAIDIFLYNFSDEFLMFVDDDCVLNNGWWKWLEENKVLEDPAVGEVWGIDYVFRKARQEFLELIGKESSTMHIDGFKYRGGTHDTIFRRKAIEGIKIPSELHVYEDGWLHHYVVCKGYKYIINPIGVVHYQPFRIESIKDILEHYYLEISLGLKYGIIDMTLRKQFEEHIIKSFIGILHPVVGFPLHLYVNIKYDGFKEGFLRTLNEQLSKMVIRWHILKLKLRRYSVPQNICSIIEKYYGGGK